MSINTFVSDLIARLDWMPPWILGLVAIALALAAALGAHELLVRAVRRGLRRRSEFTRSLVIRTRGPGRLALMFLAASWVVRVTPISGREAALMQHGLLVAFIILCGWVVMTALDIASAIYMRRYRVDVADNLLARKHLTQVRILRRALAVLVILLTAAFALMTIPGVRQLGVSLLAAGGAAGIIVGLALQPVLSNIMAGIQIALTQPIRIDDALIVEGEWGVVEEITSAYVVVRIWDKRRLIVPLKYFLEKPFQNWTRTTADLIGVVLLYLDYSTPLEPLRAKLKEIVEASPLWDREVMVLQVTDARERTMEVRCLVGAHNSGAAFDLRCEVREKLIAFLQETYPHALPRDRIDVRPVSADFDGLQPEDTPQRMQ
ncbi:Small-conductance mechanosensitive channel [Phenylobacterium zucineum HLK1]|uniref:Small-conductance mechanosensitive channel n=1 Tax=Phenylobacterium zucineum (strain HLK1) TaxID=450851 RepID=B4RHF1_PHEZH|nr:mechanosensitive ion channel domain-containing protein [Phenylobacterium zucineum]ACG77411.1 Small-conductance mechanosensitive channel [Phenylobacterium zucineum HLK1]